MKVLVSAKTLAAISAEYPDINWNRETVEDWINTIALQWVAMNRTTRRIMDEDRLVEIKD